MNRIVIVLALAAICSSSGPATAQDDEGRAEQVQLTLHVQFPHAEANLPDDLLSLLDALQEFAELRSLNMQATRNPRTVGHRDIHRTEISANFEFSSFAEYAAWSRQPAVMSLIDRLGDAASVFRTNMSMRRNGAPRGVRPDQPVVIPSPPH